MNISDERLRELLDTLIHCVRYSDRNPQDGYSKDEVMIARRVVIDEFSRRADSQGLPALQPQSGSAGGAQLDHYLLRVALESVAFHIAMGQGNFDNPFQRDRERALEYLRTLVSYPVRTTDQAREGRT